MVEWSDVERQTLGDIFNNLDYDTVGHEVLARCLIVYPWTMRYFGSFGNLYNADAIKSNAKIAAHGVVVTHGLDRGLQNLDNMKEAYKELSIMHSEKLHLDPDNFRLFCDCLHIVVASKMRENFTPQVQAILKKFLDVVVFCLSKQYR